MITKAGLFLSENIVSINYLISCLSSHNIPLSVVRAGEMPVQYVGLYALHYLIIYQWFNFQV
jgi:hypothetical protein